MMRYNYYSSLSSKPSLYIETTTTVFFVHIYDPSSLDKAPHIHVYVYVYVYVFLVHRNILPLHCNILFIIFNLCF